MLVGRGLNRCNGETGCSIELDRSFTLPDSCLTCPSCFGDAASGMELALDTFRFPIFRVVGVLSPALIWRTGLVGVHDLMGTEVVLVVESSVVLL